MQRSATTIQHTQEESRDRWPCRTDPVSKREAKIYLLGAPSDLPYQYFVIEQAAVSDIITDMPILFSF